MLLYVGNYVKIILSRGVELIQIQVHQIGIYLRQQIMYKINMAVFWDVLSCIVC